MSESFVLRPCPFCHSAGEPVNLMAFVVKLPDGDEVETGYQVRCDECGGSVGGECKDETIRLWNGAPPEATP